MLNYWVNKNVRLLADIEPATHNSFRSSCVDHGFKVLKHFVKLKVDPICLPLDTVIKWSSIKMLLLAATKTFSKFPWKGISGNTEASVTSVLSPYLNLNKRLLWDSSSLMGACKIIEYLPIFLKKTHNSVFIIEAITVSYSQYKTLSLFHNKEKLHLSWNWRVEL